MSAKQLESIAASFGLPKLGGGKGKKGGAFVFLPTAAAPAKGGKRKASIEKKKKAPGKKAKTAAPAPTHHEEGSDDEKFFIISEELLTDEHLAEIAAEEKETYMSRIRSELEQYDDELKEEANANKTPVQKLADLLHSASKTRSSTAGMEHTLEAFKANPDCVCTEEKIQKRLQKAEEKKKPITREEATVQIKKFYDNMTNSMYPSLLESGKNGFAEFQEKYRTLSGKEQEELWADKRVAKYQHCNTWESLLIKKMPALVEAAPEETLDV